MNHNLTWLLTARPAGSGTREKFSSAQSRSFLLWQSLVVLLMGGFSLNTSCSSVQSSVEAIVTGETPTDQTYAGRQHFPVAPTEAIECLSAVAPQEGWEVVNTGEEYSTHGIHGRFFRIVPVEPVGDKQALSGIFYAEPSGSYVRVSKQNGLPESLVEPLIAEIKKRRRDR